MILSYDKCCLKLVPEDSVRPETQTLVILIRRKGCVGCFYKKTRIKKMKYEIILSVGATSLNTKGNTYGESFFQ